MTDPIADMLTRIRNAQMVKKPEVIIPFSSLKLNILELLAREGWLASAEKVEPIVIKTGRIKSKKDNLNRFATIKVGIKYNPDKSPKIKNIERVSKPGRRIYVGKDNVPYVLGGAGLAVVSTPQGILSDKSARQKKVGGEVICAIY